jgi:hypothetical protein
MHTEFLVRKPEGREPFGRPKRWWQNNIKVDVRQDPACCVTSAEMEQQSDRHT